MQLPKIDVKPTTLAQLLQDIQVGRLQVPRFQRDFVWPLTKTRELLDSMYKEFPIGTFFLWRAPADAPSLIRPLEELSIPKPQSSADVAYILDGQQRLTSLFVAVNGTRLGSRDYGRISIDLEVATRYAQNKEADFNEDIFVYQTADNSRYVAVKDLVGQNHLQIFTQIPPQWQQAFLKAYQLFQTYPFSVVWIQEQSLDDAIVIFQRINQSGQRLSRYDLVCANLWTDTFDFRKQVTLLNEKFDRTGFGALHETIYTQTFALIIKDQCTTAAELSLQPDELLAVWDRAVQSLELAVAFAHNNLGVKRAEFLPYRGILPVLACFFYHSPKSAITAAERQSLWNWFWQVSLSERYSSTSPSRMAEDTLKLRRLLAGEEVKFDYPSRATSEAVLRTKMSSTTSALRNAVLCMLALRQPRNFKDGSPVDLSDLFFSNLKQAERHHMFPVGFLKHKNLSASRVHQLPNFCFIPADLNREISSLAPSKYLAKYREDNPDFGSAIASHLVSAAENAAVWRDDFDTFLSERANAIAEELNKLATRPPDEFRTQSTELTTEVSPGDRVDLLEIRLRDFIDLRLASVVGPNYWKQTMPGDVVTRVKDLITDWEHRHPYEDPAQFVVGRNRLNFCDVADYEKIILKNWVQFEDFFRHKPSLQTHMAAYRTLRNCVQHNRPPSQVELMSGQAAMTWLQGVLDQYDRMLREFAEDNGSVDADEPEE